MFALTGQGERLSEVVFGGHVLKALVAEVEQEVAGGAGKANNALVGLSAAVAVGRGQVGLITGVRGSKNTSVYKTFAIHSAVR